MENILTWAYAVLETTPARWTELVARLPVDLLTRPPAAGEWSALDCLQHLVDAKRWVFPARVEAVLAGQDFPTFDPDSQGTKPDVTQSHPRRTGLTVTATVFSVVLVVFFVAFAAGVHEKMIEDSVRVHSGHLSISGVGYLENRTL